MNYEGELEVPVYIGKAFLSDLGNIRYLQRGWSRGEVGWVKGFSVTKRTGK